MSAAAWTPACGRASFPTISSLMPIRRFICLSMTLLASRACSRAAGAPDRQTRWTPPAGRSARSRQTARSPPTVQTSTVHGHVHGVAAAPAACCARCYPRARLCRWLPVATRCAPRQPHAAAGLLWWRSAHCRHAVRPRMHLPHPVGDRYRCAGCLGGRLNVWRTPVAEHCMPAQWTSRSGLHNPYGAIAPVQ